MKISAIILLMIFLGSIQCSEKMIKNKNKTRKLRFEVESPETKSVKISNKSSRIAVFNLNLNDNMFYSNIEEIINDIKSMNGEYENEPIQKKVWIFLDNFTEHNFPLTERFWYHNPIVFINSIGFGFCDDVSMVSYYLWEEMGMKARVWGYQGHVVGEVFADNRWELYDVDKHIYYYNNNDEVAGINEIIENPEIVTSPINPLIQFDKEIPSVYTDKYYQFLANPKCYSIAPPELTIRDFQFKFFLAPNMEMTLSGKYRDYLETTINSSTGSRERIDNYSNLKISIPGGTKASFQYPLLLHDLTGSGDLIFRNDQYPIGSVQLNNLLTSWETPIIPFSIITRNNVELYFLINPYRFKLRKTNELILEGENLDSLEITLIDIKKP